jgi:trans-aconitate methyltransferase
VGPIEWTGTEHVRAAGGGLVADLGCGPGRITAHLRDLGLDAFGLDLSPAMIGLARSEHPSLRFEVGPMDALERQARLRPEVDHQLWVLV